MTASRFFLIWERFWVLPLLFGNNAIIYHFGPEVKRESGVGNTESGIKNQGFPGLHFPAPVLY